MAGGFWGRVSAGYFFLLLVTLLLFLWLLQQLFGFCPLLGGGRRVWPNRLHSPCPTDPPWVISAPAPHPQPAHTSHTRRDILPISAPPHLLPVLRCPCVPQCQGAAPAPSHSPHTMGILPTRAEGHQASAARTNLSLGDECRVSSRDGPPENLALTLRLEQGMGHQKISSLAYHPLPNSGTILGQMGNWPPLG